jgi:hypothetical protein
MSGRQGVAGRILSTISETKHPHELSERLLDARLAAAGELEATLNSVAEIARSFGGEAYYTNGDGISIILGKEYLLEFITRLHKLQTALPVAVGCSTLGAQRDRAEAAAEQALLVAKASMSVSGEPYAYHEAHSKVPASALEARRALGRQAASTDSVSQWIASKSLKEVAPIAARGHPW